jgi:2-C-methyl-D-erythritol 4-phosphate cytidylyltransferase
MCDMAKPAQSLLGILVAAGHGERFGGDVPKQFQLLEGRMLVEYSLAALHASVLVHDVVVVVPAGWETRLRDRAAASGIAEKLLAVVEGGASRQESVWRGMQAATGHSHFLVHDAARPFLTARLIRDAVAAVHEHGAATVALPVSDTLMRAQALEERAAATLARDRIWAVQTPQVFAAEVLRAAHEQAREQATEATDDGGLVLALGRRLDFVPGNWWNLKVTTPEDLHRARCILKMRALLSEEGGGCFE